MGTASELDHGDDGALERLHAQSSCYTALRRATRAEDMERVGRRAPAYGRCVRGREVAPEALARPSRAGVPAPRPRGRLVVADAAKWLRRPHRNRSSILAGKQGADRR